MNKAELQYFQYSVLMFVKLFLNLYRVTSVFLSALKRLNWQSLYTSPLLFSSVLARLKSPKSSVCLLTGYFPATLSHVSIPMSNPPEESHLRRTKGSQSCNLAPLYMKGHAWLL